MNIGIIGIGQMGKGLLYQSLITEGINCTAIMDLDVEKCRKACKEFEASVPIFTDASIVTTLKDVDVIIDATNAIEAAAKFDSEALVNRKHLVMMNAEADLIFGPYFMRIAKERGVSYTSCDGDQPAILKHMADEIRYWGFELMMAGNIKGFLDRYSNPEKIIPEADKRNIDYEMASAMTDGTKLNIEMALVANCLNLETLIPGMRGPELGHVSEVLDAFEFRTPCVEYILGSEPNGGIFVVGKCDNPYQQELLRYYKMGKGPYYLFYRHFHICHIEAMKCIWNAYLGRSLMQPEYGFKTNVYAYAKRDLKAGQMLDGIGCFDCYGLIENNPSEGLPICLAEDVKLKRDVKKDREVLMTDIEIPDRIDFKIFQQAMR